MNCRPGELAIKIYSKAGNEGRIVRCVTHVRQAFRHVGVLDAWMTDPMLANAAGMFVPCPDASLRPIRDPGDDAQDETLQWLPVPSQHKEVV